MSLLSKASIGFLVAPGFRGSDIVNTQLALAVPPRHAAHFVGESLGSVRGQAGFPIAATATFQSCPELDVLVVGDVAGQFVDNPGYQHFIKERSAAARFVIGISRGVIALAKAGLLQGRQATTDGALQGELAEHGAVLKDQHGFARDGKYFTCGPSTGAYEAAFAVLRELAGDAFSGIWELTVEYNPSQQFAADEAAAPASSAALDGLASLKVAVVVSPGMFIADVIGAVDVLQALPQTDFFYVWKRKQPAKTLIGPETRTTTTFDDCPEADVVVLGAMLPRDSADQQVRDFLIRQERPAKAIICTCAGVLTVGSAGLLRGRQATTNFQMTHLLPEVGAVVSDKEVVRDGKFYSAGPAAGSYESTLLAVRDIHGDDAARHIEQHVLEFRPQPVFGFGTPRLAGKLRTAVSRAIAAPLVPFYRRRFRRAYEASCAQAADAG